jgi:hypothetical protein
MNIAFFVQMLDSSQDLARNRSNLGFCNVPSRICLLSPQGSLHEFQQIFRHALENQKQGIIAITDDF